MAGAVAALGVLTAAHHPEWGDERLRTAKSVRLNPRCARAHLGLGAVYEERGYPRLAGLQYRRAVRLSPKSGRAPSYMANLLLRRGQVDRAVAVLRQATEKDPLLPRLWFSLGRAHAMKGKRAMAETALGWACHLDGRPEAALRHLLAAAALEPDSPAVLAPLAFVQEAAGRSANAVETWRRVLRVRPGAREAREALERLLREAHPKQ